MWTYFKLIRYNICAPIMSTEVICESVMNLSFQNTFLYPRYQIIGTLWVVVINWLHFLFLLLTCSACALWTALNNLCLTLQWQAESSLRVWYIATEQFCWIFWVGNTFLLVMYASFQSSLFLLPAPYIVDSITLLIIMLEAEMSFEPLAWIC